MNVLRILPFLLCGAVATIGCADDAAQSPTTSDAESVDDSVTGPEDAASPDQGMDSATDTDDPDMGCIPSENEEEYCDDIDNDCDGLIDEGLSRRCYDGPAGTQGRGACADGTQTCAAGDWGSCSDQTLPAVEICDALDNDCDGSEDEGVTQSCGEAPNGGAGECSAARQSCEDGEWGECGEPIEPMEEVCDGLDNDCDGNMDEGFSDSDSDGFADCIDGDTDGDGLEANEDNCPLDANPDQSDLDEDGLGDVCDADADGDGFDSADDCAPNDATIFPGADERCNTLDDDCDGRTDEVAAQPCFDGPDEALNIGRCVGGEQRCEGGNWFACQGQVLPEEELCNGQDDDCDGTSDETLDPGWPDADGDGFGDGMVEPICPRMDDMVGRGGDCDDSDPNVYQTAPDLPDENYEDTNCDGVDGDMTELVFVDSNALQEDSDGSVMNPFDDLQQAVEFAAREGRRGVAVAAGLYSGTLTLFDGVSIYGGYDPDTAWSRSAENATVIRSEDTEDTVLAGVWADGIISDTTLMDLVIETGPQQTPGGSTYGIYANDSGGLYVVGCAVNAGDGGVGADGAQGDPGAAGENGQRGGDCGGAVGAGGGSVCGQPGFQGGAGSDVRERGRNGEPEGCGGRGGNRGQIGSGDDGRRGCDGQAGPVGVAGDGFSNSALRNGIWTNGAGAPGGQGGSGIGGGGGGGGGGGAVIPSPGGAGGGGGGAGCGGLGGRGGMHGGGSFGLFAFNSAGLRIERSSLTSSAGGQGGRGGLGGPGGSGGSGGRGGEGARAFSCGGLAGPGDGGRGGRGGDGGQGGPGQSGNGGPSIGIYCVGGAVAWIDSPVEPGEGGAPGPSEQEDGRSGRVGNTAASFGCD